MILTSSGLPDRGPPRHGSDVARPYARAAAMDSNILLVDDDPAMIQVMGVALSGLGQLRFATSGLAALQQARAHATDLILLDAEMPGMDGYQVCEATKNDPALRDIPVIFVTGHDGVEFELRGLESGAVDFISKPINGPLLLARVKTQLRVKHLADELRRIATVDSLTDLNNRRRFDDVLDHEWRRALRSLQPVSLLMIDVDHFKLFNDRYGHSAGDDCLRRVAAALRGASLRPSDLVARYGGEEFAVLLPQTSRLGAGHMAQRVLDAVAALDIPHEASPTSSQVTVSIGVGSFEEDGQFLSGTSTEGLVQWSAADLVLAADAALYAAKDGGRDQTWQMELNAVGGPHPEGSIGAARRIPRCPAVT